ncbi:MAG: hypothetical protein FJ148_14945 [Deltaproteobacteria bacterium]|nr:hypothetical protein [Deltaproteobacteria bacterium]
MINQKRIRGVVRLLGALALALAVAPPAGATIVAGGGPRSQDCLAVFDVPVALAPGVRSIRCVDGDPACDADGLVNGECRFPVAVCANSTSEPLCSLSGVQSMFLAHAEDNGDPKFDPDFQALQSRIDNAIDPPSNDLDSCTSPSNITVLLKGPFPGNRCRSATKVLKLTTTSTFQVNRFYTDTDTLRLTCRPAVDSCDPLSLFDGTFDRIQKQVFNASCATSGCHDSQSQASGLLLEIGAAYAQTVGVTTNNGVAQGLGWQRITPGDPALSYLFRKVTGDLGVGLGSRMPLGRPPLAANLIEILRLWIEAGAPETGWVAGTDA